MPSNIGNDANGIIDNLVDNKKILTKEQQFRKIFPKNLSDMNNILWANGIYNRADIQWYKKFNRFGALDPFNAVSGSREYLFFTKPDLHIVTPGTMNLNNELKNQPYFNELLERYSDVITQLQDSNGRNKGPFMTLLSNSVKNTLELPSISSSTVDTPATIYGTSYNYRGWGFPSDEKVEFSLEFEDSKFLEVYNLVKAYEEYERLKHIGMVTPPNINNDPSDGNGNSCSYYIKNKILHDQFSIYKFIVEDDGETIIYYAKLWGVFFKNVPRDAFSDMKTEGGLRYAIDFEAAFIDDMNPTILSDFNELIYSYHPNVKDSTKDLPIYNSNTRMIDGRWATTPIIVKEKTRNDNNVAKANWGGPSTMKHTYKLKWRI